MNYASAYNRPQGLIVPPNYIPSVGMIDFTPAGVLPGIAQRAQNSVKNSSSYVRATPYFTVSDFDFAQWFTTRVHLAPIGKG